LSSIKTNGGEESALLNSLSGRCGQREQLRLYTECGNSPLLGYLLVDRTAVQLK
jgi:hypothetical protein